MGSLVPLRWSSLTLPVRMFCGKSESLGYKPRGCVWLVFEKATVMEGVSGMWLEGRRRGWSTDKQGRERACWVPRDMRRRMLDLEFHSASGKPVKTFLVRTAKIFKCQWARGSVSQADQSKWPAGGLSEDRALSHCSRKGMNEDQNCGNQTGIWEGSLLTRSKRIWILIHIWNHCWLANNVLLIRKCQDI